MDTAARPSTWCVCLFRQIRIRPVCDCQRTATRPERPAESHREYPWHPATGVAPARSFDHQLLRLAWLLLHHAGKWCRRRESNPQESYPSQRSGRCASACFATSAWFSIARYPIVGRSGRRSTRPGIKPVSPRSAGDHNFLLPSAWRGRIVTPEPVEDPARRRCCHTAPVSRQMTTWHRPRLASGDGGGDQICTGVLRLMRPASCCCSTPRQDCSRTGCRRAGAPPVGTQGHSLAPVPLWRLP